MVPREPRAAPVWLDAGERRGAPPPSLAKCKLQLLTGKRVRGAINFACMPADNEGNSPWRQFRCQSQCPWLDLLADLIEVSTLCEFGS